MIDIKKLFHNKHRAYILVFCLCFIALRVPYLVSLKIEKILLNKLDLLSQSQNIQVAYDSFNFSFPANVLISNLHFYKEGSVPLTIDSLNLTAHFFLPPQLSLRSSTASGEANCLIKKWPFLGDYKVSCNLNNIELGTLPYFSNFNLKGPLSLKGNGSFGSSVESLKLNGEFLSQIDTTRLQLPATLPSFIKVPNLGLVDLKGKFDLQGSSLTLSEGSLASPEGDLGVELRSEFEDNFSSIKSLNSDLNVKLSSQGIRNIAPWLGLLLGGQQFPANGEGTISVSGDSRSGIRANLVR